MQKIKYITCCLLSLLLFSCKGDFFDSIVEVKVPVHESNLAITAHLSNLDIFSAIHVTHTLGILEDQNAAPIKDAVVELYEDGQRLHTYEYMELYEEMGPNGVQQVRDIYLNRSPKPLMGNKTYELRVSTPEFGEATATQQLAVPTPIISATFEEAGFVDIYGERGEGLSIKFKDRAGEKQYYAVQATGFYTYITPDTTETYVNNFYLSPADPITEEGLDLLLLSDATFDGKEYELKMVFFQDLEYLDRIEITLYTITEDRFLYEKSILTYEENDGNPFAEPVVIHENISQGNGIFTMSAADVNTIKF